MLAVVEQNTLKVRMRPFLLPSSLEPLLNALTQIPRIRWNKSEVRNNSREKSYVEPTAPRHLLHMCSENPNRKHAMAGPCVSAETLCPCERGFEQSLVYVVNARDN